MKLSNNHWVFEGYSERMTTKQWRAVLLNKEELIFFNGHLRKVIARDLGVGVVEVYKEPLECKECISQTEAVEQVEGRGTL